MKPSSRHSSHQEARMLLPPSAVSLFRTRTFKYFMPNFRGCSVSKSSSSSSSSSLSSLLLSANSRSIIAVGVKSNASPAFKLTMVSKMPRRPPARSSLLSLWFGFVDVSPDAEGTRDVEDAEAPARWAERALIHAGEVNRCTKVIEQRSRSLGEIVGSWVAMMTRVAKCRCWRITLRSDSVKIFEAEVSVMNLRICQFVELCGGKPEDRIDRSEGEKKGMLTL
jgi:hypothetical protein